MYEVFLLYYLFIVVVCCTRIDSKPSHLVSVYNSWVEVRSARVIYESIDFHGWLQQMQYLILSLTSWK